MAQEHPLAHPTGAVGTPEFDEAYEKANAQLLLERVRLICVLACVAIPSFWSLDWLVAPTVAWALLRSRVAVGIGVGLIWLLTFTGSGQRHIRALLVLGFLISTSAISFQGTYLGGFESVYYFGNLMCVFTLGLVIPWSMGWTLFACGLSVLTYAAINLLYFPPTRAMIFPIFIQLSTSLLTGIATLAGEKTRRRDLGQRLQIEKAHEELKKLDEMKTRFMSNVSHELRTPLTLILGPVEAALGRGENLEPWALEAVAANSRRLLRQVNALLDLAKLDAGKLELRPSSGNLGKLLDQLLKAAQPMARKGRISLTGEGLDGLPDSELDGEKMETVAANLISNALKFTPAGGSIRVVARREGGGLAFTVSDTGIGIPREKISALFQRFSQVNDEQSRAAEGTGLGLAMVKELANLHGGSVSVESEPGQGSAFTVRIPLQGAVAPAPAGGAPVETAAHKGSEVLLADVAHSTTMGDRSAHTASDAENARVEADSACSGRSRALVVDDNADLRSYIRKVLSGSHAVFTAVDGKDGYEKAARYQPDLILSDVMMPVMTGSELCRAIRADADLRSTPFVLLTARASLDSKIEGLEDGVDDYLSKPFSERELLARIHNLILVRQQQLALRRELKAAREIQHALLPPLLQSFGDLSLRALYQPCEQLSGDFFDWKLHDGWLYLYLADVTSHGTAAAQVTYLMKTIFQDVLSASGDPPLPELMARLDEKYKAYRIEYDIMLQLARCRTSDGTLEYLRAGAPSAFHVTPERSEVVVVQSSPHLTSRPTTPAGPPSYKLWSTRLASGARFFIYTDGTYEGAPSGARNSRKSLNDLLASSPQDDWPDFVLSGLRRINGSPEFADDVTVLELAWEMKGASARAA